MHCHNVCFLCSGCSISDRETNKPIQTQKRNYSHTDARQCTIEYNHMQIGEARATSREPEETLVLSDMYLARGLGTQICSERRSR